MSFSYPYLKEKTIIILKNIKDTMDIYSNYDMPGISLNGILSDKLKTLSKWEEEIEILIGANYIKKVGNDAIKLTDDGISVLRNHSIFKSLNVWGKILVVLNENSSLSLVNGSVR